VQSNIYSTVLKE